MSPISRRRLLHWSAAAVAAPALGSAHANTAAFPAKPVRILVGNTAGSGADVAVRIVARQLQDDWRQPVTVENRTGAGGLVAAEATARSDADGHTLSLSQEGAITIAPALQGKLSFDPLKELAPVVHLADSDYVLVVNAATGWRTIAEMVAAAKKRPGAYSYASAGVGSLHHLAFELLKIERDFFFVHIPYRGGSQAVADVASGQAQAMWVSVTAALPHIQSGRLRALAIGGAQRSPLLPAVPTAQESIPGFRVTSWFALFAPVRTPAAVVERIAHDASATLRQPAVLEALRKQGITPVGGTPQQLAQLVRRDYERYARLSDRVKLASD
ncbi:MULTISPECIES: tripartite tricarboxylate transporter substrate binding protein [unclassified Rubrivivax]|uniref:Bug family tripartite tricarboxylate transporter substrate binding protein n=1 Tax=unclassified Rubrivivax TaxID=2649762 RepID=UPI001E457EFE|nr:MULTISPECIES: tripartite tricarboxylate transporter substrate binding protein [unclassified Rubrivivax]MCC9597105.1 tripartite tricarboxylate transporter substrate binding protein [Rubrivivax sp. JA1055]MCC9646636.1 tripartite tricarboxylate transporter substrate binding protein [Rubrivivax sp. JA1029]